MQMNVPHQKNSLGAIVRCKARLLAKGCFQVAGVDFNENFALVAMFITIRCILTFGTIMDLDIYQMDVKVAYFNGILEVEIDMDQPEGFVQEGKKTLYANSQRNFVLSKGVVPLYRIVLL